LNNEGHVTFQGLGPFHLPSVLRAIATGNKENGVTLTLFSIIDGKGSSPRPIEAQMPSQTAREVSAALLLAAEQAEAG
jgi:hypothetical protein